MKKALLILTVLYSCSSYRQIEFINENMTRFNDNNELGQNTTPKILGLPVILQNRDIASIAPLKNKKQSLNNKQLYFQILNTQMHQMGEILGKKIINNRCPHFHSINMGVIQKTGISMLEEQKELPENTHYTNALKRPAFFPELHLPMNSGEKTKTVFDLAKNKNNFNYRENIKTALSLHLERTKKEIHELCETGSSGNYYIYENLNALSSGSPLYPKKENLETILKISIFTNDFLISSLKRNSNTKNISAALDRVGSRWFQRYVETIITKRD
tara:strand:+ start:2134 stop:2952 length:819 start_codon:yes stop_codon:yes gene_type:complete